MAEEPGGQEGGQKGFWPDWLTPRRAFDFARNIVKLESTLERLQADNRDLRVQPARLQNQMAEHNGQLQILVRFVDKAIDDRIENRIARHEAGRRPESDNR